MKTNLVRSVVHISIEKGKGMMNIFTGFVDKVMDYFVENKQNNDLLEIIGIRVVSNQVADSCGADIHTARALMKRYCYRNKNSWLVHYTYAYVLERLLEMAFRDDKIDIIKLILFGDDKILEGGMIHFMLSKQYNTIKDYKLQTKYL